MRTVFEVVLNRLDKRINPMYRPEYHRCVADAIEGAEANEKRIRLEFYKARGRCFFEHLNIR